MSLPCHDRKYLFLYGCRSQLHKHKCHKQTCKLNVRSTLYGVSHWCFKLPLHIYLVLHCKPLCVCVRESYLDPAEHAGIEDIHASVDLVRDEDLRFLYEALYPAGVVLKHHHTVLRGLLHPRYLHTHSTAFNSQSYIITRFFTADQRFQSGSLFCLVLHSLSDSPRWFPLCRGCGGTVADLWRENHRWRPSWGQRTARCRRSGALEPTPEDQLHTNMFICYYFLIFNNYIKLQSNIQPT